VNRDDNFLLAQERRDREDWERSEMERLSLEEVEANMKSPFLREDASTGMSADGTRYRRDMFRGFTQSQIRHIFADNQRVQGRRKQMKEGERLEDGEPLFILLM